MDFLSDNSRQGQTLQPTTSKQTTNHDGKKLMSVSKCFIHRFRTPNIRNNGTKWHNRRVPEWALSEAIKRRQVPAHWLNLFSIFHYEHSWKKTTLNWKSFAKYDVPIINVCFLNFADYWFQTEDFIFIWVFFTYRVTSNHNSNYYL